MYSELYIYSRNRGGVVQQFEYGWKLIRSRSIDRQCELFPRIFFSFLPNNWSYADRMDESDTRMQFFFLSLSLFLFFLHSRLRFHFGIHWMVNESNVLCFVSFFCFLFPPLSFLFSLFFLFARSKLEMKRYSSINRPIRRSIQRFFHCEQGYLIFHSWNTISTVDSTTEDANVGKLHSAL